MNSQTTELLPCPFCGGEAYVSPRTCNRDTPYNPADRAFPVVRCRACFAEAVGENWGEPATAVTAWHRRAALEHAQRVAPRMLSWKEIEAVAETDEITGDGICVFGEELLRKFCEVNGITSDAATPSAGEAEPRMAFCPACFVEVSAKEADQQTLDARRYRWLRDQWDRGTLEAVMLSKSSDGTSWVGGEVLDGRIDAVLASGSAG